jgi:peptidyl-prolyl cis-trans isomerase SurA
MAAAAALLLAAPATLVPAARAQEVMRIAAVVNDDVISILDLNERSKFALITSGLQDTPEVRRRLRQQVLRALIDERLQVQEAERLNISITQKDIDEEIADLEKRNNMPPGGLSKFMNQAGVEWFTMEQQVRANISWRKLVRRQLGPRVVVGDDEVEATMNLLEESQGKPQYRVSEIFLSIDSPDQEEEVMGLARRLQEQLRAGANFAVLANQFSQSASAAVGGDLGWVPEGQLDEALDDAIGALQPGQISPPIKVFGGVTILQLRQRSVVGQSDPGKSRVTLRQVVLPLPPEPTQAQIDEAMAKAREIKPQVSTCADLEPFEKSVGALGSGELGTVQLGDLPAPLRKAVSQVQANQLADPIVSSAGVQLLMVCEREDAETELPNTEQVRDRLRFQRLDLLARRYLRDLRRSAFVDVRV